MSELLTAQEAATAARRHPVTIRKALEAGKLHGFQRVKGGRWTVSPGCLDAWVEGRKCEHRLSNVTPIRQGSRSA